MDELDRETFIGRKLTPILVTCHNHSGIADG
jgi:hypothetical protein